jgi:hypothetical protein
MPNLGDGGFILSMQRYYRTLLSLLNTTYIATCFGRTTIFMQKYISYDYSTDNGSVVFRI